MEGHGRDIYEKNGYFQKLLISHFDISVNRRERYLYCILMVKIQPCFEASSREKGRKLTARITLEKRKDF
ncbi:hypothetical protein KM043_010499 [Ampulex compressa]|nr:hypothetical protein KM043_010499 [Ampulex compressa]